MGYYENPPIINMSSGSDKLAQGILDMSQSFAKGLLAAGERRREEEKEEKLSLKKLQQQKNETDLLYNDRLSDWSEKNKYVNKGANDKVYGLLQSKIAAAADARIALLNETDPTKRSEYLKTVRQADMFMNNSSKFAQIFAGETSSYINNLSPESYGVPGGMVVNGTPEQLPNRIMALDVMTGAIQKYQSHSIDIEDLGDTFKLKLSAVGKDGKKYEEVIDASSYLNSDAGGTGTFLQKVINNDDWIKSANKVFYDEKSDKILQKYLSQEVEDVRLPVYNEKGIDSGKYRLAEGQRLDEEGIRRDLRQQAEIKASAFLKAGKDADLRAYVNYTVKKGKDIYYYDNVFRKDPNQKETLTNLLIDDAFETITSNLRRTKEKGPDGKETTVYWDKETKIKDREVYDSKSSNKNESTTIDAPMFNKQQVSGYAQQFAQLLKDGEGSFIVNMPGPEGGAGVVETFMFDKKHRVVSDRYNIPFRTSEDFKKYLRSKTRRSKLIK